MDTSYPHRDATELRILLEPDRLPMDLGSVRAEVRRLFRVMGAGGGYVLANVHNIQPDVPPYNILALFDASRECRYAA
jgi:uroporphyrinogen-III decarboxylase